MALPDTGTKKTQHIPPTAAIPLRSELQPRVKRLKGWESADLDRFKFTTFQLNYLKHITIILLTTTQTSCPCQQKNYFCVFQCTFKHVNLNLQRKSYFAGTLFNDHTNKFNTHWHHYKTFPFISNLKGQQVPVVALQLLLASMWHTLHIYDHDASSLLIYDYDTSYFLTTNFTTSWDDMDGSKATFFTKW